MGYNYYLKQDNFHFFITKLNSDRYPSKVEWKFEAFEYRDSMYTSNYCLTICNTLSEAKRCIFNAYKFLSKNIVSNYKSNIINTPIIIDILKLEKIQYPFIAMTTDKGPDKSLIILKTKKEWDDHFLTEE